MYPLPVNPGLQVQLSDPLMLLHTASLLQLCLSDALSSMSKIRTKLRVKTQENKAKERKGKYRPSFLGYSVSLDTGAKTTTTAFACANATTVCYATVK